MSLGGRRSPAEGFWRQGAFALLPDRCLRLDACGVVQSQRCHALAQRRVDAIACVHQHHALRNAVLKGLRDLRQRDLRLGCELNILRHARLLAPVLIIRPLLRQIETIRDGKARMMVRNRKRNGDLAIVLLAELAAISPRYSNGVLAFLRKTRVIDDPGFDRAVLFQDGKRQVPNLAQNSRIGPRRVANEMQKRLMLRRHP